jgi:hypothetical protein
MFSPLYRLPALPILPVNSIIFTILPANLKPGKSSTLVLSAWNDGYLAEIVSTSLIYNELKAKAIKIKYNCSENSLM